MRKSIERHKYNMGIAGFVLVVLVATVLSVPFSTQIAKATSEYKAVFIIGRGCEDLQPGWESDFKDLIDFLEQRGVKCHRVYSPNAHWSTIEPVIQDANFVFYAGHGFGYDPDPDLLQVTDPNDLNGWYIDRDESIPHDPESPEAPYTADMRAGWISRKVIQRYIQFAPNAMVFMGCACYAGGKVGGEELELTGLDVVKKRVEDYSETFIHLGASYVYGPADNYLSILMDEGKTLEQARDAIVYTWGQIVNYHHPQTSGKRVKFNYWTSENSTYDDTYGVVAGNLSVTASDILPGYEPPEQTTDLPRQEPTAAVPSNYSEYLLVSNPSTETASVRVEFTKPSGNSYSDFQVPAGGRHTLNTNEFAFQEDVSLKLISDTPVVAERAMYFDSGQGRTGGHATSGLPELSNTWYFAEGYTAELFDEYILLQNPHSESVTATLTLMRDDGYTADFPYTLEPYSRTTIHVDELAGFEQANVSAKVTASKPIAAERAMYFDYQGSLGGHVEHGVHNASKEWYLAEGYTVGFVDLHDGVTSFDSYVLIQNPNAGPASVHLDFQKEHGQVVPFDVTVPPNSRYTIPVDTISGLESTAFSTHVTSDKDIIVERSMYFNYRGQSGGHVAAGLTSPSSQFFFAEGYTAGEFDTYLLLQNPNDEEISVTVTYNVDPAYGQPVTNTYTIYPNSRYTVPVDNELPAAAFGMTLNSESEFMAERAMYFNYGTSPSGNLITGGHDTTGVPETSTTWYFAEGYTGN